MATRLLGCFSTSVLLLLGMLVAAKNFAAEPADKRAKVDGRGDPLPSLARLRIGTTRFRHGGEIIALAFSPDGGGIATMGRDRTLRLWDAANGKVRASFHAPEGVALAFAQRGQALLWCDVRGHLYRCDAGQRGDDLDGRRQPLHHFDLDSSERIDVAVFTPDGSAAALGTSANRVFLWGRNSEIKLRDGIQAMALDRDGKLLATNNGHEGIRLQDVSGQRESSGSLRSFGTDAVCSLTFSSDGRILAVGDFDNRIHLWDANSGRQVRILQGHRRVPISGRNGVFCLTFRPDGKWLASGAADGTVRVWDVERGKEVARCAGHGGRVRALAFAPDGQTLASGGADNVLRLWEPATGRAIGPSKDDGGAVTAMSVSPDGRTLAVVRLRGQLRLWGVTDGKQLAKTPKLPAPVRAAVFTANGRTLVSASVEGHLHFWDLAKGEEQAAMQNVQASIRLLAAANDGATLAWYGDDRRIVLWDGKTGKKLQQFRARGNTIAELLFSPDGETFLAAESTGVRLFAVKDQSASRELSGRIGGVSAVAVSPDGRMLATGGQDGVVRLWEMASCQQRRAMYGDTAFVRAAAFSADGALLAAGSSNGLIRLWDVASGQRLHIFSGHRGAVIAAAFAGRASTLLTASVDGTVFVWDLPALMESGRAGVIELSARQLQALWRDLGGMEAPRAYEAGLMLARASSQTVPFLREQLSPVSAEKLIRRIEELDSDSYESRVRAMKELAEMGKFAEPALRKLLQEKPSLEARRRADELLALLDNPAAMTEYLRVLRAVEVLEWIGSTPARKVLQTLAEGAAEATITRQAKAALARLCRSRDR